MGNISNFTRSIVAAVGAIILSATFVTAAVGPAASASNGAGYAAAHSPVLVQDQQA